MEVIQGGLRGMGSVITPMCISLIGACGLRIIWIFTVFQAYRTPEVLFLSYAVSWTIVIVADFIAYVIVKKRLKKRSLASV